MKKIILVLVFSVMFSFNAFAEEVVVETPVVEETPVVLVCEADHQVLNEEGDACVCESGYKMNDEKECVKKSSGGRVIGYIPNFNYEEVFGKKEVKVEEEIIPEAPEIITFTTFMKVGSIGEEVKKLQGYLNIEADGVFGPITKKAVMEFQAANGLVADGIVGILTLGALNK